MPVAPPSCQQDTADVDSPPCKKGGSFGEHSKAFRVFLSCFRPLPPIVSFSLLTAHPSPDVSRPSRSYLKGEMSSPLAAAS